MGLFDGVSGVGGEGSCVDLARVLACPILLVVDAGGMSGSIAALVSGFVQLAAQKQVGIAGIIANKVGSAYHAELLQNALLEYSLPPLVAWMERNNTALTERHLGLTMPEPGNIPDFLPCLHVDHLALMQAFTATTIPTRPVQTMQHLNGHTIAIARDGACCFVYPANLDWLQANGAKLIFFSPVAGEAIPNGADAVWLPGGYPELHVEPLSQSKTWASLHAFINAGKPVLAECGGAMLLGKTLVDSEGVHWPMANIFPFVSIMQSRLVALGHRTEKSGLRGHEFHYSKRENDAELPTAFEVNQGDKGVRYKNTRASYIHWYFSSEPNQAAKWLTTDSLNKTVDSLR
jgi:cobyrinic acid a,c-diamide synthase